MKKNYVELKKKPGKQIVKLLAVLSVKQPNWKRLIAAT